MLLALISDLHFLFDNPIGRIDNAHKTQKEKMKYFMKVCKDRKVKAIIQAGDMFDMARHWRLLSIYARFLMKYKKKWYGIFGQHDMYMRSNESKLTTNLGILSLMNLVTLLNDNPIMLNNKIALYGCNYGDDVPKVKSKKNFNILSVHGKICMYKSYPNSEYAVDYLDEHEDYDLIICGDSHSRFLYRGEDNRIICNTGCLIRKVSKEEFFDNPWQHEPGFYLFDTSTREIEWITIPHKPIEEVLSRKHLETASLIKDTIGDLVLSLDELADLENMIDDEETILSILIRIVKENDIEKPVLDIIADAIDEEIQWR